MLSRDLALEYLGSGDRDSVSKMVARCERGKRLGELDVLRRRADLSTYTVWYPSELRGVPVTPLEKAVHGLGVFSAMTLKKKLREMGGFPEVHIKKTKTYLELMVEDGTLVRDNTGINGDGYRWSYGN